MTPEDRLIRRYAVADSRSAFDELVRRHYSFVAAVCRRQLGDPSLADDVTQAVFLLMARKAQSLRPGTVLTGWLFQTAVLACRNARRSENRRRHYEQKAALEMDVVTESGRPPGAARLTESAEKGWSAIEPYLDDALARLSKTERDAVLLRYVEEMTLQEVGVALGITAAAAHKRISRALERLRRHLQPASGVLSVILLAELISERMAHADQAPFESALMAATEAHASARAAGIADTMLRQGRNAQLQCSALAVGGIALVAGAAFAVVRSGHVALQLGSAPSRTRALHTTSTGSPPGEVTMQILTGRVVDATGKPIGEAPVVLARYAQDGSRPPSALAPVTTDRAGRYRLPVPMSTNCFWVAVSDTGSRLGIGLPDTDDAAGNAQSRGCDTVIEPPAAVRLQLVDRNGEPLAHVMVQPVGFTGLVNVLRPRVSANVASGASASGTENETQSVWMQSSIPMQAGCPARLHRLSDDDGIVSFSGLPRGWTAQFAPGGSGIVLDSGGAEGAVPLSASDVPGVRTLHLVRSGTISGTVTFAGGTAVAGVRVEAQSLSDGIHWGQAFTDPQGRYAIAGLAPDHYNVAVDETSPTLAGAWTAVADANIAVAEGANLAGRDMTLIPGGWIEGNVVDPEGKAVTGIQVGVYGPAHPQTSPWVEGARADAGGRFRFRVPPGRAYVYVMTNAEAERGKYVMAVDGAVTRVTLLTKP